MNSFKTTMRINFDDTDAAGICFFGRIYSKIHRAYEEFLSHLEVSPEEWFLGKERIVPIRHLESDFTKPLLPFRNYEIEIWVSKISQHSFQLSYNILYEQKSCGTTKMTHIFCDKGGIHKIPVPVNFRAKLQPYLKSSPS